MSGLLTNCMERNHPWQADSTVAITHIPAWTEPSHQQYGQNTPLVTVVL